ncbi:MAG TPA: hypothetical protein VGG40_05865 [Solirubrobacterales bacterium]|jgi:hypothetical protein
MASVETTTIRVRRTTHKRLQEEAERQGKSVTELLDEAADTFEEQSMLLSAERAWEELAAMPPGVAALDGSLTDEEIARLGADET